MKNNYFLPLVFILTFHVYPQQTILQSSPWVLQNFIVNQVEMPATTFSEILFYEDSIELSHLNCYEIQSEIVYFDPSAFNLTSLSILSDQCLDATTFNNHRSFYFDENQVARNPFTYEFSNTSDWPILTVTNNENNKAVYLGVVLNVNSPAYQNIYVYPIPVANELTIKGIEILSVRDLAILDVSGKRIFTTVLCHDLGPIDVSQFHEGIYFLKITTIDGHMIVKKFLKS